MNFPFASRHPELTVWAMTLILALLVAGTAAAQAPDTPKVDPPKAQTPKAADPKTADPRAAEPKAAAPKVDPQEAPAMPYVGVVKADNTGMHVRGDPNTVRVARAAKGELVMVRRAGGSEGAWLEILSSKPITAYISAKHVKKIDEKTVQVAASRVHLRPLPSTKRQHFTTLMGGTRLRLLGQKDEFSQVLAPKDVPVWVLGSKIGFYGSTKECGAQFDKARADARALAMAAPVAAPVVTPGKAAGAMPKAAGATPKGAGATPKGAGAVPGGVAGVPGGADDRADEGKAYLARLETLGKRYETANGVKSIRDLKAVLADLEKLEKAALALKNERTRFKVSYQASQLITKAKLAIIGYEHAQGRPATAKRPNPTHQPDSGSVIKETGWIKREGGAFARRTRYRLEKGNVVLYYLMSPRYDLAKFVNKHVALTGEVLPRKDPLASKVLEVKRLKILSH